MTSQFMIAPVTGARVIAEKAEQLAHEVRRTVAAVEAIVDDVKVVYKAVVSPLVEWLKVEAGEPSGQGPGAGLDGGLRYKIHRVADSNGDSNTGSQRRTGPAGGSA